MDRSPVLKAIKHDDVIEIDDDADDTNLKYTLPDGDIFYLTEYWTSLLKQVLSEIKSKSTFKLSGSITKEIYNSCIFYGFFECLDYGLNVAGKVNSVLNNEYYFLSN